MDQKPSFLTLMNVIILGTLSTILAELLNYFLVYKKDDYRNLVSNLKVMNKKLDKVNETLAGSSKTHDKKKAQIEENVKMLNTELTMKKFKSTFCIGLLSILSISYFSSYFTGQVVAKLPFVPFGLIQGLSHRGIEGTDYTDCSFIFMYIITGIVVRTNVQKVFGFEGPQTSFNPFVAPQK